MSTNIWSEEDWEQSSQWCGLALKIKIKNIIISLTFTSIIKLYDFIFEDRVTI